jgi:hypothetical protein
MSAGERATTPPIPPQRYRWKDPTPPAVIDYLQEENRVLLEQLGGKRRRFASLKLSMLNLHHVPLQLSQHVFAKAVGHALSAGRF